ncbi:MAG: hypothetical protein ACREQ2_27045 [Candidatus Binatia bacterium]
MPGDFCCPPLISGHPARFGFRAALVAIVLIISACSSSPPVQDHLVGDLGHIEVRKSDRAEGVVIGATQGSSEPDAAELATALSDETGAGLVIAYGFRSKRIPVAQPLVHMSPVMARPADARRPGSVYPQFRALLQNAVDGPLKFYIGVRSAGPKSHSSRIEVATAGLTVEQVEALKAAFIRIRDRVAGNSEIPKVEMALNPVDEISWNVTGVKNHGVLLLAEKGLILRMPKIISTAHVKAGYTKVLTGWVAQALPAVMQNPSRLPAMEVQLMQYGRMESTPSRKNLSGIVIGAPHGSFDRHTAELAQQLGYRTSLAVVAAKGFSPTEGGGWRINVNRPTEKLYPRSEPEQERATDRARAIYQRFRDTVLKAAAGPLDLYIDLHQNSHDDNIDVATLGVSPREAGLIKAAYMEIRQRVLRDRTGLAKVNLAIEPIDKVTFRARVAKEQGILRWAKQSLHFEMPAHRVFYDTPARYAYTEILSELIQRIVTMRRSSIADPVVRLAPNSAVE